MKLAALIFLLLTAAVAHAAPYACKAVATNGFFTVTWCNLDPGVQYFVEWNDDPTFLLSPVAFDLVSLTGEASIQMTESQLFVRLTEQE